VVSLRNAACERWATDDGAGSCTVLGSESKNYHPVSYIIFRQLGDKDLLVATQLELVIAASTDPAPGRAMVVHPVEGRSNSSGKATVHAPSFQRLIVFPAAARPSIAAMGANLVNCILL
jgi:hypothetical protein